MLRNKYCVVCLGEIKIMCRVGTDICSENCEKKQKESDNG